MSELNMTGKIPVQYRVLVLPDEVEEESSGGIFIPIDTQKREKAAMDQGTLIATSRRAFTGDAWEESRIPQLGEKVFYDKYAGTTFLYPEHGDEKKEYRLLNDQDIIAVQKEKG